MDLELEFDCPQFVDFDKSDKDASDGDSYFDRHADTEFVGIVPTMHVGPGTAGAEAMPLENVDNLNSSSWQRFQSRLTSTPAPNSKHIVPLFNQGGLTIAKKTKKGKPSVKNVQHQSHPAQLKKSVVDVPKIIVNRVKAVPVRRLTREVQARPTVAVKPSVKKAAAAIDAPLTVGPRHATKRKSSCTKQVANKKPKLTHPKTPECLKRSMMHNKVMKSSEDIELDRIAEMRKQQSELIRLNQRHMKRIMRPSKALPTVEEFKVPKVLKAKQADKTSAALQNLGNNDKKSDGFKIPPVKGDFTKANPITTLVVKSTYALRNRSQNTSSLLGTSVMSNKSLHLAPHCGMKYNPFQPKVLPPTKAPLFESEKKKDKKEALGVPVDVPGKENDLVAVSTVEKKANKKALEWRKNVEVELENQKKKILSKKPKVTSKAQASRTPFKEMNSQTAWEKTLRSAK